MKLMTRVGVITAFLIGVPATAQQCLMPGGEMTCLPVGFNSAPIARLASTGTVGAAPFTVNFDASTSHDREGDALTYRWDFGNGIGSSAAMATHTWNRPGAYEVALVVNDGQQDSLVQTATIVVTEALTGAAQCSYQVVEDWEDTFTATVSIKNAGARYIQGWNVQLDLPDGAQITHVWNSHINGSHGYVATNDLTNGMIAPNQTVSFGFSGTKAMTGQPAGQARLGGVCGSTTPVQQTYAEVPVPRLEEARPAQVERFPDGEVPAVRAPTAFAVASAVRGSAPLTVHFDGRASTDALGNPVTHQWRFDDGSESTAAITSRTFTEPGSYSVSLVVSDGAAVSEPVSLTVLVTGDGPAGVTVAEERTNDGYDAEVLARNAVSPRTGLAAVSGNLVF